MDLRSICMANGVGVVLLLILRYVSHAKVLRHRMEDRIYTFMVFGVMGGCVMEALSYLIDGRLFPGSRAINYFANAYLFSVNILLPFCVLAYVDLGLYGDPSRIRSRYRPQVAVGVVMVAATLASLFVPISFRITEGNVYERMPFGYVYYGVILYYCLTALFLTRRYERDNGARAFFNVGLFLVPILAGAALQFVFYGLSIAWLSAAIGLTGLFMMQQNEMAYTDSLVDLYNRQYLSRVLSAWAGRGNPVVGAMLDIDDFKAFNDGYGHSEGDRVLRVVADILKDARREDEWVFRYAGDEFIVLTRAESADYLMPYFERVERGVDDFNRGGRPYRLSLSYGMARLEGDDVDAFMREMDERMYQMKALHHGGYRKG